MQSIIERLQQGKLWDFPGGVNPPERKQLSNQSPIKRLPLPPILHIPLKQHVGVEGTPTVKVGDQVYKGQVLTRSMNPFSVPVHAPTSGTISAIEPHVSSHPSGLPEMTVHLQPDGEDEWLHLQALKNYQELPKAKVVEAICKAGIAGLGGAGFPTHIKVNANKDVEFLVINGIECEPYITSDDRLMQDHAWQIRQGIDVLTHLLSPKHVIIAVEDNKPKALQALRAACQENRRYLVVSVPTKYPAGGEKQLIQVLTNREVPSNGLPIDVGVIMQNVGTCFAIADAIFEGKPLLQRVVTLTGRALEKPGNYWALLGTPVSHLLQLTGYDAKRQGQKRLIMGGPMMGFTLASDAAPVVKITNCILVPDAQELPSESEELPCIRCSACADACPAGLLPQQLFWHSKAKEYDKAQEYNLFDCIECGACAYVCPSQIPLVHYYRVAKADIRAQDKEQHKADKARERFEARKARLEREQQERQEKHRKAAEARQQAAAAREKAAESNTENASSKSAAVAAAIARAKAKKAQAAQTEQPTASEQANASADDDKKAKVAAAIARAKAKKAQAAQTEQPSATEQAPAPADDDKKAKVAAAIARAKAKKQARDQGDAS